MSMLPQHQCLAPSCGQLADSSYCAGCAPKYRDNRPSAAARGYGRRWQVYSKGFLVRNPFCVDPYMRHEGQPVRSEVTDHRIPHKGDMVIFWDKSNHQPLCQSCNSYKAARDEGGFGNEIK